MKKLSLALLFLLVAIGLVGPKFAGNAFNKQLDGFAAKLSEQPLYKASVEEREQSWFSTTATLVISLDTAAFGNTVNNAEQAAISFSIPVTAQHGPLLTQSGLSIGWIDWQVNMALAEPTEHLTLSDESEFIYVAEGITNLLGTTYYSDFVPALTYTDPQSSLTLSITGWQGHASLSSDSMNYETDQPFSLEVSIQGTTIATINNMSVDADLETGLMQAWDNPLYNGEATFNIDSMTMVNPANNEETKINGIVMESVTRYDDNTGLGSMLISSRVASFVDSVAAIEDIQLDFEVVNLQNSFFKAYQALSEDIVKAPDQTQSIVQAFMRDAGLAQLQANPEMNFPVIKAAINESQITGFANSKLVGITALPDTLEDATFWAQHAVVDAELAIEEGAALFIAELILKSQLAANPQFAQMSEAEQDALITQQSQATINAFVQQGILSQSDDGYEMTFSMENANALLNGQPMGLPF